MVTSDPAARVGVASLLWAAVAASGLFQRLLSDNAFYCFEIARNAARGQGVSFDSLAPTDGFHPLWAGLLLPLYALFPDSPWIPARVAPGVSALCIPLGAVGIQRLVAGLGAPRAGELAAYTWLLNPLCAVLGFRGMETPLAALLMLVSLALLVRSRRALENVDVLLEEPEPYLNQMLGAERARRFLRRHVRGPCAGGRWPVYEVVR